MMNQFKRISSMFVFLFISVMIYGQGATTSSLSGKITDSKGAPMPGASIVAVHVPSGTQYATIADNSGNYRIPEHAYRRSIYSKCFFYRLFNQLLTLI